jgi:hypothetical protein
MNGTAQIQKEPQAFELLTPAQLAREINTTPQTVNTWHRDGIIPAKIAVGRIVRFDRTDALEALARHSRKTASRESAALAGEADDALDMAAKKPVTVKAHQAFRESITARHDDSIDELVEELRTASKP